MLKELLLLSKAIESYDKLKNYNQAINKWLDGLNNKTVKPCKLKLMLNDLKVTFKAERNQKDIIFKCEKLRCIKCSNKDCGRDKYITFCIVENDNKKIIHYNKTVMNQGNDFEMFLFDIKNEEFNNYVTIISYIESVIDVYNKNYTRKLNGD